MITGVIFDLHTVPVSIPESLELGISLAGMFALLSSGSFLYYNFLIVVSVTLYL